MPAGTETRSSERAVVPARAARREDFAVARRNLHVAIKASKHRCWKQLCDEADRDVWGKPYRTVMSCLKGPRGVSPREPELVRQAVSTLFPRVRDPSNPPACPDRLREDGEYHPISDESSPATSATGCWSTPPTTARRPTASQRVSPQGSVLGPILWNAMYNKILGLRLPGAVSIVGFADDIALTIV
ncbi:unnamed protein product [Trichogramma brassicae]|uniref:Reverse transcriptase domain-containing protein n=1 Tax=Trichogramma brassicae TaxID=86971 RepID=A0A6H5IVT9_9HYME|nr:unnamed protein product [Trichogramma brassicae]